MTNFKLIINSKILFLLIILFPLLCFAQDLEVRSISFGGGQPANIDEITDIIRLEEGDKYDARLVKLDKILLTNYFKQNGYLDIFVGDSIGLSEDRRKVDIKYMLSVGKRYYFWGIKFYGQEKFSTSRLQSSFNELSVGSPFNENSITQAMKKLENAYYNNGKPFAEFEVNYIFEKDSLIIVRVDIEEHETIYVKEIRIIGRDLVQKFLITRELEFGGGDIYDRRAFEKSQQNIYKTGLFKYVRFELEPLKDDSNKVVVNILLQEKNPRWFGVELGIAYEQEKQYGNTFEFTLQGGHRNLFGTGRSLSLHLTPSILYDFRKGSFHNVENAIALRFVEPWIGYTRTPGIFMLAYEQQRSLNSGSFDMWKTSFSVTRKFWDIHKLSGTISAKLVDILSDTEIDSALAVEYETEQTAIYSVSLYWKRDDRKNIFYPLNSAYTDAGISFSHSKGKDENKKEQINQYITFTASWNRYQPFRPQLFNFKRWNFTLASRIKIGSIFDIGGKQKIPISDRFFAGGVNTVRGYQEQLLGPALEYDDKGKILKAAGGKMLFLANIEVRMPIVWIVAMEMFMDGGYVWPEIPEFNPGDIKFTTGLGVALITPVGPVRLDYGYKLMPVVQDPTPDAWHFGVYFAF